MKVVVAMTVLAMCPDALAAGKRTIEGTIRSYGCEALCYLTVVDAHGKKHDALCGYAPLCGPWTGGVMPRRFVGRKVSATVTKEWVKDDPDGEAIEMDVFSKIKLLR